MPICVHLVRFLKKNHKIGNIWYYFKPCIPLHLQFSSLFTPCNDSKYKIQYPVWKTGLFFKVVYFTGLDHFLCRAKT